MKKLLLAIAAIAVLGISACKKIESETSLKVTYPIFSSQKDTGSWD